MNVLTDTVTGGPIEVNIKAPRGIVHVRYPLETWIVHPCGPYSTEDYSIIAEGPFDDVVVVFGIESCSEY